MQPWRGSSRPRSPRWRPGNPPRDPPRGRHGDSERQRASTAEGHPRRPRPGPGRRAARAADGLPLDRFPASGLRANRAGHRHRPPRPEPRSPPHSPPVQGEPREPRERRLPQRLPGLARRAKQIQSLPAPGALPAGRAAAERRRAPKRWPTQRTGDGAEALGAGPQAVACRWESAAFRPLHPRRRLLQTRQQTLGPGTEPERGPTGRGRAFPVSGKDRRSSAALVGRKEADETAPAPKRDARRGSGHETESGGH